MEEIKLKKTIKKSIALLMTAIMLASTFTFICSAGRETVNVTVTAPKVGEKAEYSLEIENENYIPGILPVLAFEFWRSAENNYEMFGKVPTMDECGDIFRNMADSISSDEDEPYYKSYKAMYSAEADMFKTGIMWFEYDEADLEKLYEQEPTFKNESRKDAIIALFNYSEEYGLGDEIYSSTIKYLKPGDSFVEGKSYACCVQIIKKYDEKALNEVYLTAKALSTYFEKKIEINKKLENADEAEITKLNSELEALDNQYREKLDKYDAAKRNITFGNNPVITVNGSQTEEHTKGLWFAFHDFGEAEKGLTMLGRIIAFFQSIIDFFKSLLFN